MGYEGASHFIYPVHLHAGFCRDELLLPLLLVGFVKVKNNNKKKERFVIKEKQKTDEITDRGKLSTRSTGVKS